MLSVETRPLQHLLRGCEIAEPEDAGECVVELRLLAIERVLELVVREQRRVAGQLRRPSEGSAGAGLPSIVSVEASTPSPSFQTRATSSGCSPPVHGEARGHPGVPVVQVLPVRRATP